MKLVVFGCHGHGAKERCSHHAVCSDTIRWSCISSVLYEIWILSFQFGGGECLTSKFPFAIRWQKNSWYFLIVRWWLRNSFIVFVIAISKTLAPRYVRALFLSLSKTSRDYTPISVSIVSSGKKKIKIQTKSTYPTCIHAVNERQIEKERNEQELQLQPTNTRQDICARSLVFRMVFIFLPFRLFYLFLGIRFCMNT